MEGKNVLTQMDCQMSVQSILICMPYKLSMRWYFQILLTMSSNSSTVARVPMPFSKAASSDFEMAPLWSRSIALKAPYNLVNSPEIWVQYSIFSSEILHATRNTHYLLMTS